MVFQLLQYVNIISGRDDTISTNFYRTTKKIYSNVAKFAHKQLKRSQSEGSTAAKIKFTVGEKLGSQRILG
jgi:hypothetical protein